MKLIIQDPCDSATVTVVTPSKIEYVLNAAEKSVAFAKWETNPVNCKDKVTLKLTIPSEASGVVTYTESTRTVLAKTGTAACTTANNCIKEHTLTLGAYGPSGTLLKVAAGTTSATTFKLEIKAAASTTAAQKPGKSGLAIAKDLVQIFGNAAGTIAAGTVATGGSGLQTSGRFGGNSAGKSSVSTSG